MSKPTSNLRLFVAAYPPEALARELVERVATMTLPPGSRIVAADHVHMTLQFIGDMPAAKMESVRESIERSASGLARFTLALKRLIVLPQRGPGRLIAAETGAPPALLELHDRLAKRLARNAREKASDRFLPHVTLCRFASPTRGFNLSDAVLQGSFEIDRIMLMRSTLWHGGATHHELLSVPLI